MSLVANENDTEMSEREAAESQLPSKPEMPLQDGSKTDSSNALAVQRPAGLKWILFWMGQYLIAFCFGLDTTIVAAVQASIYESLGEIEKLGWVGMAFSMGNVCMILLTGKCFGLFEIKWLLIGNFILFQVGNVVCGAAPNMNAIIVGRVIAGIGGAGCFLGALNYVAVFTTMRERSMYNALLGVCWGLGSITGPPVGGAFASNQSATWRWAFYLNLPIAGLTGIMLLFFTPRFCGQPTLSFWKKLLNIDWIGSALHALAWSLLMIALTMSGSVWAWDSAGPIALWVIFGVSAVCYVLQSAFSILTTPQNRILPIHIFKSTDVVLYYIGGACAATGLAVTIYYIPLLFAFTKGDSPIHAAVRLLPFVVPNSFFFAVSGGTLPIVGRYKPYYILAGILMLVGSVLLFRVTPSTHVGAIYGFELLIGVGCALTCVMGYALVVVKVQPYEIPEAIGVINVAQTGSIGIALSVASCIFQNVGFNKLEHALQGLGFSSEEIRITLAGVQSPILHGGDQHVADLAIAAITSTIAQVFATVMAAGALSIVVGAVMKMEKLDLSPPVEEVVQSESG